jgi:regulator of replication initiation timing
MKKSTEGEHEPLPEDLADTEENIKNLIKKTEQLKQSIKFGFSTVRNLQLEIGTIRSR